MSDEVRQWLAPHIKESNSEPLLPLLRWWTGWRMGLDRNFHGLWCLQMTVYSIVRAGSRWRKILERSWKDEEWSLSLSTGVWMGGTSVEQWVSWRRDTQGGRFQVCRSFIPYHGENTVVQKSIISWQFSHLQSRTMNSVKEVKCVHVCWKGGRKS